MKHIELALLICCENPVFAVCHILTEKSNSRISSRYVVGGPADTNPDAVYELSD